MPLLQAMTKPSNIFFNKLLSELEYFACPSIPSSLQVSLDTGQVEFASHLSSMDTSQA